MELEEILKLVTQDKYHYSSHADERMAERDILDSQVKRALLEGEILEVYEDDARGKSFLVLGKGPIHVLVGYNIYRELAIIITTYIPEPPKWFSSRKRG